VLKIGRFSRLAGVTIRTLRFYDRVGLFQPAHVSGLSGYRFYRTEQLPALQYIRWLRELGCSIAEIRELLAAPADSPEHAHRLGTLRKRLMLRVALDEQRLKRLDTVLDPPVQLAKRANCAVLERRIRPVAVLGMRDRVRSLGVSVERMFEAAERKVAQEALRAPRSPFLLLHDMEYRAHHLDVEVCVPVAPESMDGCGGRMVPGVERAACARFSGAYRQAPLLYELLLDWMSDTGTRIAGAVREVYLRYGADQRGYTLPTRVLARSEADYRTELQIPVAGA
jgi:DNA-binding transcriptional MerR regulator